MSSKLIAQQTLSVLHKWWRLFFSSFVSPLLLHQLGGADKLVRVQLIKRRKGSMHQPAYLLLHHWRICSKTLSDQLDIPFAVWRASDFPWSASSLLPGLLCFDGKSGIARRKNQPLNNKWVLGEEDDLPTRLAWYTDPGVLVHLVWYIVFCRYHVHQPVKNWEIATGRLLEIKRDRRC